MKPMMVQLPQWHCQRCGHTWVGRITKRPARCPACKSPYWDKPKRRA